VKMGRNKKEDLAKVFMRKRTDRGVNGTWCGSSYVFLRPNTRRFRKREICSPDRFPSRRHDIHDASKRTSPNRLLAFSVNKAGNSRPLAIKCVLNGFFERLGHIRPSPVSSVWSTPSTIEYLPQRLSFDKILQIGSWKGYN